MNFSIILLLLQIYLVKAYLKGEAQLTYYLSFPACCKGSHIYNPHESYEEVSAPNHASSSFYILINSLIYLKFKVL